MSLQIDIEPIPANPGYVAYIRGTDADPECDPAGDGPTRLAATLALARALLEDAHPATCLAIAAVIRQHLVRTSGCPEHIVDNIVSMVEGIA